MARTDFFETCLEKIKKDQLQQMKKEKSIEIKKKKTLYYISMKIFGLWCRGYYSCLSPWWSGIGDDIKLEKVFDLKPQLPSVLLK